MIGGSSPRRGWEFFSSPPCLDRLWGPPNLLFSGYQGFFSLGVKRLGHEADHSHPLVPRSRMRGDIPPLPQHACMALCSVEAQEQFYLLPYGKVKAWCLISILMESFSSLAIVNAEKHVISYGPDFACFL
jgi:hypothetical protein